MTNPTTATVIRLDFKAILKLHMILLLKDECRVKGLKQLLRINEDGHVFQTQFPFNKSLHADFSHKYYSRLRSERTCDHAFLIL